EIFDVHVNQFANFTLFADPSLVTAGAC
ncbi:MAG: hypothetical protein JWO94_2176, partial [Verrucomicrobiaceae bacterium]|nr:hypothetical protein [Verrucomicrobiaceae bacterium]